MRMSLPRQLLVGYAATILLTVLVIVAATAAMMRFSATTDDVIGRQTDNMVDALRLHNALDEEALAVRGYLLTGNEQGLEPRAEAQAAFDAAVSRLSASLAADARDLLRAVEERVDAWTIVADDLVAQRGDELDPRHAERTERELIPARQQALAAIDELAERQEERIAAGVDEAEAEATRSWWIIVGLGLVAVLVSVATGVGITRRVSRRVEELSGAIDGATADIVSGTQQQLEGAARQSTGVQETVATVEELERTAEQSAERARSVAETAQRSAASAEQGRTAVQESIAGMEQLRGDVDDIAGAIVELAAQAQTISDVVRTVDDIAEQTHLLALNASIEAARAGEHGRGFAVVAGEVRSLAEESRTATGRVGSIIEQIQGATHEAVMVAERGTKSATRGAETVAAAGTTIDELAATIEEATLAAEQIAGSAGQQAIATSQITQAMHDIRDATEQGLASSHQVERRARELDRIAEDVRALTGRSER